MRWEYSIKSLNRQKRVEKSELILNTLEGFE